MTQQRILIVEDERPVADLIRQYLLRAGYGVSGLARSGEEALQCAGQTSPDLALMDIQLEGAMDGVETARRLLSEFNIPVVFLTALADDRTLERSRGAQAFGYLLKPFREEELKASIELALEKHRSDWKLKRVEHWFAATLQAISDAVITIDHGGRITFLNAVAEQWLGVSESSWLGAPWESAFRLCDEATQATIKLPLEALWGGAPSVALAAHAVLLIPTRRSLCVEARATPIQNDPGEIIGAVVIFRDISERKRQEEKLDESEGRLRAIIDSEPQCVKLMAADGTLIEMNPAGLGMIEADSLAQVRGASLFDLVLPEFRPAFRELIRATFEGGTVNLEFGITGLRGTPRWLETHAVPFRNPRGEVIASLGITRDITARKRSEFRSAQIAQLGHALNSATTPLEAARRIVEIADRLFGWDACYLYLYSAEEEELSYLLAMDQVDGQRRDVPPDFHHCPPGPFQRRILVEGSQLILRERNLAAETELSRFGDTSRASASMMFVPVRDGKRILGICSIQSYRPSAYTAEDLVTLQSLADHCGGALERIRVQDALRESEERFHAFMNHSPAIAFMKDEEGRYIYGNKVWAGQFGPHAVLLGKTDAELWPEAAARKFRDSDLKTIGAQQPMEFIEAGTKPNGDPFFSLVLKFIIRDTPGRRLLGGLAFDITERKAAEETLQRSREQLRSLAARLQSIREEERIRIAREIHDELGQMLTGFKMDLSWLERRLFESIDESVSPPFLDKIKAMSGLLDEMVHSVRKISSELRPGMLDDLGLVAAMEWQAREFEDRTGLPCDFHPSAGDILLSPDLGIAVFRIFQEALTNVARHAGATRVVVTLCTTAPELTLEIRDNGRGITERELANSRSLGLLGMRERALILGGSVHVSGTPGQGTIVAVQIPLHPSATPTPN